MFNIEYPKLFQQWQALLLYQGIQFKFVVEKVHVHMMDERSSEHDEFHVNMYINGYLKEAVSCHAVDDAKELVELWLEDIDSLVL